MFAAAEGVPVPTETPAAASSSSPVAWVDASNVTLPSATHIPEGVSKRDMIYQPQQHLAKRAVPHPGEPSPSIKINVIGGATMDMFTLLNETGKATPTPSATGSSSSATGKVAATTNKVNIVNNGTYAFELPTVTETMTFTAPRGKEHTATVTLVPTLAPGAGEPSYVPFFNTTTSSTNNNGTTAECTLPSDVASASNGTTVTAICETVGKNGQKINVNIKVDASVAVDVDTDSESTSTKQKRGFVAFFQAPAAEEHENTLVAREVVEAIEERSFSREEMMSEAWEDCEVGVDEGCLAIPEL